MERYGRRPALRFVRACALDDPAALALAAHIFTWSKPPWVILPEEVPAFAIYYDMAAIWQAESLERRRAILGDCRAAHHPPRPSCGRGG